MSSNWQKIEHIYQEALEREPGQRAAYIKEACGGDEVLLREVESLLAYQPRAEDFLAAPALQVAARKLAEDKDHTLVGRQIGAYQIVSLIGRGGMGEVYRATDTRLKRTVAIKVLPSHLSGNPELRQRLEREARAVSNLNHPHICTLYDIGTQDGIDFLVMEYLEGETLSARLKRGALSLDQVLNYSIEIADALSEAHRRGIVHRDLKPGNIMLTKNGAKLLDFGLAKHRVQAASSRLSTRQDAASTFKSLTEEGTILGTLEYMAPEHSSGGNFYLKASNGAGNETPLLKSSQHKFPEDWSRDGRFILYSSASYFTRLEVGLWVLPLFGDHNPFPYLESAAEGQFSPNGQRVAYISPVGVETEKPDVYVRSFPSSENKWRISTGGGYSPRWHRDGKELFYLAPGDKLMSVQINEGLGTSLEVGRSKLLFEIHNLEPRGGARHSYAVSADGQYFYLLISDYSAVQLTSLSTGRRISRTGRGVLSG